MGRARKKIDMNLDSLLDILSNVVGVMILIAVIIVLNSKTTTLSLGMPIQQDPPIGANRLLFECRNNRVAFLDVDGIDRQIDRVRAEYRSKAASFPAARKLAVLMNNKDIGDARYRVTMEFKGGVNFIYTARKELMGERPSDLIKKDSGYQKMLAMMDPAEHYLVFFVRPSGYEVFRAARRVAKNDYGLTIGWEPIPEDARIILRAGGKKTPIQE